MSVVGMWWMGDMQVTNKALNRDFNPSNGHIAGTICTGLYNLFYELTWGNYHKVRSWECS